MNQCERYLVLKLILINGRASEIVDYDKIYWL